MSQRYKRGQSTLEYVLLVTAVIVVIITLVFNPNSPFKTTINGVLSNAITGVSTMGDKLNQSH